MKNCKLTFEEFLEDKGLSHREIQVVKLAIHGLIGKEIGSALSISISCVKTHLANIYKKLNIKNRVQLILLRCQKICETKNELPLIKGIYVTEIELGIYNLLKDQKDGIFQKHIFGKLPQFGIRSIIMALYTLKQKGLIDLSLKKKYDLYDKDEGNKLWKVISYE